MTAGLKPGLVAVSDGEPCNPECTHGQSVADGHAATQRLHELALEHADEVRMMQRLRGTSHAHAVDHRERGRIAAWRTSDDDVRRLVIAVEERGGREPDDQFARGASEGVLPADARSVRSDPCGIGRGVQKRRAVESPHF